METVFAPDFQCQFLIGPAIDPASGAPAKLGAVVAKRTWAVAGDGTLTPAAAQEPIATADDPATPPRRYESDLVLIKDRADLVLLDPARAADPAGVVYTVTRTANGETLAFVVTAADPDNPYQPILGWRDRGKGTRVAQAGDAANFHHDQQLLPTGFQNRFFNGMVDPQPFSPWQPGETIAVKRTAGGATSDERSLTLPAAAPATTLTLSGGRTVHPPMRHDTVVWLAAEAKCLTAWRATWPWAQPEPGVAATDEDYLRLEVA